VLDLATLLPIKGALVRTELGDASAETDATGRFVLPLAPKSYTVSVEAAGYITAIRPDVVDPNPSSALDFRLFPQYPSAAEQILLFQRSVRQVEAPLIALDGATLQRFQANGLTLPATIPVYYDPGYDQNVAGPPPPGWSPATGVTIAVPLESYVQGVVPNEVPASWPAAVLEAQAVAARTYGIASSLARGYVYPDTRSQVYNPANRTAATDSAAAATAGQAMTYGGAFITAFFFSRCNGISTHNSQDATVLKTDANGNLLTNAQGQYECTPAGWNAVPYCVARPCTGHSPYSGCDCGYNGHGVGMCQWGAYYRANAGMAYQDILNSYYTGISFTTGGSQTLQPLGPYLIQFGQSIVFQWTSLGNGATYNLNLYNGPTASGKAQQLGSGIASTSLAYAGPQLSVGQYTWTVQGLTGSSLSQTATAPLTVASRIYSSFAPLVGN
jgi:hypothetical protein